MRDYYKTTLKRLKLLTGIDQAKSLTQAEVSDLLDSLTAASARFPRIPAAQQQQILDKAMLSDKEFYGLSQRWVYKHLLQHMQTSPQIRQQISQVDKETEAEREARNQEFLKANPDFDIEQTISRFKQQIADIGKPQRVSRFKGLKSVKHQS